jgi:hypothetical protein
MWKITLIWCIEYYLKVFPRSETMGILDMIKTYDGYGWQGDHHTAVVSISDFSARPNNSNFVSSTFYLHV